MRVCVCVPGDVGLRDIFYAVIICIIDFRF